MSSAHRSAVRYTAAMLLAVGAVASSVLAQPSTSQADDDWPFRPDSVQTTPTPTAGDPDLDALQFSGVSMILAERSFNFTDSRNRKNFWVPMHGTENNFTVVDYDERAEQVVVRRGSHQRTIPLKKVVLVAMPATPTVQKPFVPSPPVTTAAAAPHPNLRPGKGVDEIKNPQTPEQIKQAEYEARMLVSDLLDISVQERARQKALRDAQARGQAIPANGQR